MEDEEEGGGGLQRGSDRTKRGIQLDPTMTSGANITRGISKEPWKERVGTQGYIFTWRRFNSNHWCYILDDLIETTSLTSELLATQRSSCFSKTGMNVCVWSESRGVFRHPWASMGPVYQAVKPFKASSSGTTYQIYTRVSQSLVHENAISPLLYQLNEMFMFMFKNIIVVPRIVLAFSFGCLCCIRS